MNCSAKNSSVRGSALVYILIAIALLGVLTASLMDSSSQQTTSQNSSNLVSQLNTQISFIRSAIQECVLSYPAGDTTMPANPVGGQNPVRPYPLRPYNTYLANPVVGSNLVSDIRCPGNPGNSNDHAKIFSGTSGKYLPPPPKLFSAWQYYNSNDGVFLDIETTKSDSFIDAALKKLDANFASCETQYVDASSGDVNITANGEWKCLSGRKCFIVRILSTASAIYPQETATCP